MGISEMDAQAVPPAGDDRRAWIRHELQRRVNPETTRRFTQADVARAAGVNESTVSLVYTGRRAKGPGSERVMQVTARILGMEPDALFGTAPSVPATSTVRTDGVIAGGSTPSLPVPPSVAKKRTRRRTT